MSSLNYSEWPTIREGTAIINENSGSKSDRKNEVVKVTKTLSPDQANITFNQVIVLANKLINSNRKNCLKICRTIRSDIDALILFTDTTIKQKELNEAKLAKELIQANSNSVQVANQICNCRISLDHINTQLAHTNSYLNDLNNEYNDINNDIEKARKEIEEEEQISKNAVLDTLVPLYGLIDGLIKGQPKRGILGYSAVKGINSAIHKEKEAQEKRLSEKQRELRDANTRIEQISTQKKQEMDRKSHDEGELLWLQGREKSLEQEIKKYGKELTQLRNILLSLKGVIAKYHFLQIDVDTIEGFSEVNLLDTATILSFVSQITQSMAFSLEITHI